MSESIKNVAIFGATGMTGLVTLPLAVAAGYNVTVLVRDPVRLPAEHKACRVVVGDVLNKEDVKKTMEGQDAVIIILGTRSDLVAIHRSHNNDVRRNQKHLRRHESSGDPQSSWLHVRYRVLDSQGHSIFQTSNKLPYRNHILILSPSLFKAFLLWDRSKVPPRLLPVTEDHDRMYMVLKESGLDCVAVMPPHIDDNLPLTEKYTVTENMLKGRVISKYDLGHFFVKCLSISDWDRKTVGVCGEYS
uniref:NAD(P)-binding domain-containing protein n=1 Tax=Oncorhynchus tshawytscha TaxID=74940 RepID=A0AAZ3Q866_ONCTS